MTYAFIFDASACTGCKACQVACKDKNNLPVGVLWRRVFEVAGGSWLNVGAGSSYNGLDDQNNGAGEPSYSVWKTDVFAYYLSIACNHCEHPKCAGVCPTDAYIVRADGIVYIDESKCMGCGYCAWACPYAAPQNNPVLGRMTKCDFCFDNLDAGLPPSCVSACPMRVLDYIALADSSQSIWKQDGAGALWTTPASEHPFPLPDYSRTDPHLAIKPHVGMVNGLEKTISNREEVNPPACTSSNKYSGIGAREKKIYFLDLLSSVWRSARQGCGELPLVIFTLCGQMAAGMAIFSLFMGPLSSMLLVILGGLIGAGGLISFLHLGTPLNAWRAANNLRKSWLSREIFMFWLFALSWLMCLLTKGMGKLPLALTGAGLVFFMSQVYRLRTVPAWATQRTFVAFSLCAGILGLQGMNLVTPLGWMRVILPLMFIAELALAITAGVKTRKTTSRMRSWLITAGMAASMAILIFPHLPAAAIILLLLLTILEEFMGRWLFYASRYPQM